MLNVALPRVVNTARKPLCQTEAIIELFQYKKTTVTAQKRSVKTNLQTL
jgi:hypothetical protein